MTFAPIVRRVAMLSIVGCAAFANTATAGPPLLVHPYTIGQARSLPWSGREGRPDYDRRQLLTDTVQILAASPSVIVHAETLRRAVIYARTDTALLSALVSRLVDRADASQRSARPDPLVLLDAGYIIEAVRQMDLLNEMAFATAPNGGQLSAGRDGYAYAVKALALRPDNAELHFAACLIAANQHPQEVARHERAARSLPASEELLAKNLDHLSH